MGTPVKWTVEKSWAVNNTLHDQAIDAEDARVISRLLAGGQGLRGGDCRGRVQAAPRNCCYPCLLRGERWPETLEHVCLRCSHYQEARAAPRVMEILGRGLSRLAALHRDIWSWSDLRTIRYFLL